MSGNWHLTDGTVSLVLAAAGDRLPEIAYVGPALADPTDVHHNTMDIPGGTLDAVPACSICPSSGSAFPGQSGLCLQTSEGAPMSPDFRIVSDHVTPTQITLTYRDDTLDVTYQARFALDHEAHVITCMAKISSAAPMRLDWLCAPAFPAPQSGSDMTDFAGRWIGELRPQRTRWSAGIRLRDNPTGRSGHEHFPALICPDIGCTNTQGTALAFHYAWSGGHKMVAEELPDGRRQVQFGAATGSEHAPATVFETAPLHVVWTDQGLNGIATAFQRHLRPGPQRRPRPVHYNCWEAVYFDHDLPTLKDIATRAATLGAERFVLDDGWFKNRNDDTSSLGDWLVDTTKYPDGLTPLIDHLRALGLGFGLWVEPEMVNPDSDLYRAHPDWALGSADQVLGRNQMVLNLGRADVRAYLFNKIDALLSEYPIEYLKWDHNRVLPGPDAAQTRGIYTLLSQLQQAHPDVEIESCASGGGRIDHGILAHTGRVWLSDSNDAMERLRIQHEAALFLPWQVTGSHVGPRHCHTSGRVIDMETRAWVAAQRHMGFEMDPRELTEAEARTLIRVTTWWKTSRDWRDAADILRLDAEPAVIAEQHMARDGSRFVVFAGLTQSTDQMLPRPLRLTGLEPHARYELTLLSRSPVATWQSRGHPSLKGGAFQVSGQYLMHQGVNLPWTYPQSLWVFEGTRI